MHNYLSLLFVVIPIILYLGGIGIYYYKCFIKNIQADPYYFVIAIPVCMLWIATGPLALLYYAGKYFYRKQEELHLKMEHATQHYLEDKKQRIEAAKNDFEYLESDYREPPQKVQHKHKWIIF